MLFQILNQNLSPRRLPMTIDVLFKLIYLSCVAIFIYTLARKYPQQIPYTLEHSLFSTPSGQTLWQKILHFVKTSAVVSGMFAAMGFLFLWISRLPNGDDIMRGIFITALTIVCWNLFAHVSGQITHGKAKVALLVISPFAAAGISVIWVVMPIWIVYDFIAILMGYAVLSLVPRFISPAKLTAILVGVVLYDIWGVYGSIQGQPGVIVQIVTKMTFVPPLVVLIPDVHHLTSFTSIGLLGLGDIVLPGLAIMASIKYGRLNHTVLGWVVGLLVALVIGIVTHAPVPATITLVPATLFPALWRPKLT